ncbi:hypothetical protein B0H13DRAFT_1871618 [Mycena leptocephala]|nr:hypothetical protein B0H13DRAFT_1871618 [Mycena leptocephala]
MQRKIPLAILLFRALFGWPLREDARQPHTPHWQSLKPTVDGSSGLQYAVQLKSETTLLSVGPGVETAIPACVAVAICGDRQRTTVMQLFLLPSAVDMQLSLALLGRRFGDPLVGGTRHACAVDREELGYRRVKIMGHGTMDLSTSALDMDTKSEDRIAHRAAAIKNEQTASPKRKPRAAAKDARAQIALPFQPGGALDTQVDSQQFVEGLYENAGQDIRVRGRRSESPPNHDEDMKEELTLRTAETEEEYDRLRTASPSTPHEELSPRAVEAEEECDRLRDELQTTKLELEKMKQTLLCAQRVANQWRNAARKASTALERAAKDISFATDELDVVEEVFEQI